MTNTDTSAKSFTQSSANKLREKVIELSRDDMKSRLALGEVIHELYYGAVEMGGGEVPLYKFFGFDSWFDYVETEVGLHISTAAAYRNVWDVFGVKLAGSWDRKIQVSFTKLRALSRVVTAKNVNAWLKKAEKLSCCELEDAVYEELHGRRRHGHRRHFSVLISGRQHTHANTILELAFDEFPDVNTRGEALIKILEQWDAAVRKHPRGKLKLAKAG